jgi:transcriptional regulator GlxA family with amidase domain
MALIGADPGREIARAASWGLVVCHRGRGGQLPFLEVLALDPPSKAHWPGVGVRPCPLYEPLPVERLADTACLSPRQFGQAFLAETGQTPAKTVERLRARAARRRLKNSRDPIGMIARGVEFADPEHASCPTGASTVSRRRRRGTSRTLRCRVAKQ